MFNTFGHEFPLSRTRLGENASAYCSGHELLLLDKASQPSPCVQDGTFVDGDEIHKSIGRPHISTAVMETLVGLLYNLSNQTPTVASHSTLISIIDTPAWNTVLPHLRGTLAVADSNIVQAIAGGLLRESISTCHHRMLDLSLDLGADPTQRILYFSHDHHRTICTPLVALCTHFTKGSEQESKSEGMILSLLKRDPFPSNSTVLWIISAGFHAIAEDIIRSQSGRLTDFAISVSDLEGASRLSFNTALGYDPVTPLLAACSHMGQSAEKLSLIRCLLGRDAKADLETIMAAAEAGDEQVIFLLYQHWSPINGFIPNVGSPLSSACKPALHFPTRDSKTLGALSLLLKLGASPNDKNARYIDSWELSPLHILARAEERPAVTEALNWLVMYGADINHRIKTRRRFQAETALECAIERSRWLSAIQFLLADCELTGREILRVKLPMRDYEPVNGIRGAKFRQFIDALLAKAPTQADAVHWSGLTVFQRAIQNEDEGMILALLAFGVTTMPSDFIYMLSDVGPERVDVCRLSSSTQMKLFLASRFSDPAIIDMSMFRRILAFACPEIIRNILNNCADFYDSEGLCYVIARVASEDRTPYFFGFSESAGDEGPHEETLTMDDLQEFVSRRTMFNRHEDWEVTAVMIAARAGRADILRTLIEPSQDNSERNGLIPKFIIKEALLLDFKEKNDDWNWNRLGVWIKYCRMDDPNMKCSPLTAAAMVVPSTAADEVVDLLLSLNYQPDGWTILVASCLGQLSILQRLERLKCWQRVLSHKDRPDWCPTALQIAVYMRRVSTVKFLVDAGAMIDPDDVAPCRPFCFSSGLEEPYDDSVYLPRTAFQHAIAEENLELATMLLNAGANVNAPAAMDSGATALQIASVQGSILVMEYLISKGADPCAAGAVKHGRTALQAAAEHGHKDTVELLLAHGAPMAYQDREKFVKAVLYAESSAHYVVAKILRERLLPQWSSQDEETLEMLSEEWESSSEHSAFNDLKAEVVAWEKTFQKRPEFHMQWMSDDEETPATLSEAWESSSEHSASHESGAEVDALEKTFGDRSELLRAYESNPNSGVRSEHDIIDFPIPFQQDDSRFLQEFGVGIDGNGRLYVDQPSEVDLYDGDVVTWLAYKRRMKLGMMGSEALKNLELIACWLMNPFSIISSERWGLISGQLT